MKRYWALAQMPLPTGNEDAQLYDDRDGREVDGREMVFANHCLKALEDIGELNKIRACNVVLDVGCGRGALISLIAKKGGSDYIGIDPQLIENPLHYRIIHTSLAEYKPNRPFHYVMT